MDIEEAERRIKALRKQQQAIRLDSLWQWNGHKVEELNGIEQEITKLKLLANSADSLRLKGR